MKQLIRKLKCLLGYHRWHGYLSGQDSGRYCERCDRAQRYDLTVNAWVYFK